MQIHPEPRDFLTASLFRQLPPVSDIRNLRVIDGNHCAFDAVFNGRPMSLILATIVSPEDSEAWKAGREMVLQSVKSAAAGVRGFFTLVLFSLDISDGFRHFHSGEYSSLIINHAVKLQPSESRIIRFGQLYAALTKRLPGDHGKIDMKILAGILNKPAEKLDLWLKSVAEVPFTSNEDTPHVVIIHDLSPKPLFRFGAEPQTERIAALLQTWRKNGNSPESVYWVHRSGMVDITEQFPTV